MNTTSPDQQAQWDRDQAAYRARRQAEDQAWHDAYTGYLKGAQWDNRRRLVLKRANGLCEGCRNQPATQVHHLTYRRVGNEMLFDLVAVCDHCHAICHPHK